MTVEPRAIVVATLGSWGDRAMLVSEYDPESDTIRIDARAVAIVRAAFGDDDARAFVACAIEHERFHRAHPASTETAVRAHANAWSGGDAERYASAIVAALASAR